VDALQELNVTHYLSLAIWIPIVAGVVVLAVRNDENANYARWLALFGAILGFLVTIPLWMYFETGTPDMQFVEHAEWIPRYDIQY
jgi:NADH-quinone oxidoreductase subunit M